MKTKNTLKIVTIMIIALSATVLIETTQAEQSVLSTGENTANWLHFGYDSSFTSYNPIESTINTTNVVQLERKWGIGCDDGYFSQISRSPAIYNGTLYSRFYTGIAKSKLHAYDAKTGELLWNFTHNNTGRAPQPVVSKDGIVFDMEGSYPTHLYAVDGETGEELWEAPVTFEIGYSTTALVTVDEANDLVYVVGKTSRDTEGKFFALDKQTGEIVWNKSKEKDNVSFCGDYVLLSEGRIFTIVEVEQDWWTEIHVVCINASSQEIDIIFNKPEGIELDDISKCTLCNDKLVVTYYDRAYSLESISTLVVYDTASQDVLWQMNYSSAITGSVACNTTGNVLYVPTDPYLYALNATTGDEIWRYIGYGEIFTPSIANGIVYFLSDNNMYAVDEDTGVLVFYYPLGYRAGDTTQVAICDGMVYFSGNGGICDLYALGLSDQVLTPGFSLLPKQYDTSQTVTISCDTAGATIYYTINGDDPTPLSTRYLDAIVIDSTKTIKAIAVKDGMNNSDIVIGIFTIKDFIFTDNWSHFGFNTQYTSYNPLEDTINITNIVQLNKNWGIGCDDGYFSTIYRSPAIYNDTLYTSGAGSRLTAYNAQTGQMLWQFGYGNSGWAPQPVVSEDGIVFYMEETYPTYLYAVDANNGNKIWKAPIGFDLGFSGAAQAVLTVDEANDLIYIVGATSTGKERKLFALDKQTGEIVWYKSKAKDNISFRGDYVLLNEGRIFTIAEIEQGWSHEIHVVCINASSQEIEIIFDKPEGIELDEISRCVLCNDKLVVTYCDRADSGESIGTLVVYDITSQDVLWYKNYSSAVTGSVACNTTRDVIYVPTDPYLCALDASTGDEIWNYTGYGEIYNPSVANGIVYFLSDTNMYAVDENTGDMIFSYPLGNEAGDTTQVAICDGMVYFSGNGGTCDLYALSLGNQAPIADPNGPYSAAAGVPITFNGSGSSDADGSIISFDWDFGDGNTGSGVSTTHTYTLNGTYTVNLTVTDNDGLDHTASTTAVISDEANITANETVSIGSVTVDVNDTFMLLISIANVTDLTHMTLDLVFDPGVVTIINITASDAIPSSTINYTPYTGKAAIELTNSDSITVIDTTALIDITFQAGNNGTTALNLQNLELIDDTGPHAPYTITNGSITVCIKGDFNNNNKVDIGDVARVAFMVAEKVPEDLRADFNNNGCVDVGDAAKISFYLAKKVDEL